MSELEPATKELIRITVKGTIYIFFTVLVVFAFLSGIAELWQKELDMFVSTHLITPYCRENSAKVLDKSVVLKRCFKVIEVNNE